MSSSGSSGRGDAIPADLGIAGLRDAVVVRSSALTTVYRARHERTARMVAVQLFPLAALDEEVRSFLQDDLFVLTSIKHPHIVSVYEYSVRAQGQSYVVVEYPTRGNLAERLERDGPMPWEVVADVGRKLAEALASAHDAGILHGHLNPSSVWIADDGEPKLAELGLAHVLRSLLPAAERHAFAGFAPELLSNRLPTEASDVYSLASTLYTLLAGQDPFMGPGEGGIAPLISRIMTERPPDLRPLGVPEPIWKVLEAALTKEPAQRTPTARAFGEALSLATLQSRGPARYAQEPGFHVETRQEPGFHVEAPQAPAFHVEAPQAPAPPPVIDDDVQFSVFRPAQIRPDRWYPLLAYAHRTTLVESPDGSVIDPVEVVERQARALLADEPVHFDVARGDSTAPLWRGGTLLFEPWLDGGEINPRGASVQWEEPVHRVEFRLRVPASADGRRLAGGLRIFLGPLLVGEVGFRISVNAAAPREEARPERLAATRYRKIFASYSHDDAEVVKAVVDHVTVTGDRYLMDVATLRSGERWEPRIGELIEEADVFQLFWSRRAMYSEFVQHEWEHAIALGREGFVRPLYWEDPLAEDKARGLPPASLRDVHFSRLAADRSLPAPTPPPDAARPSAAAPPLRSARPQARPAVGPRSAPRRQEHQRVGAETRAREKPIRFGDPAPWRARRERWTLAIVLLALVLSLAVIAFVR